MFFWPHQDEHAHDLLSSPFGSLVHHPSPSLLISRHSIIAVMIDMDRKLTRIQVDGDLPGATFSGIPDIPGGLLCLAVDLCRGDAIEIMPQIS
jgi:hypothetical protein